jgi:DNA-binding protein YbaB
MSGAWGGDADVVFNADVMRHQAAELDAELEQARFTGQSRDGTVTAVVSGHGRLVDLTISAAVMRGAHPQAVGPDVVEAVTAARRAAVGPALVKMRTVLDKDQEWHPEPVSAQPNQPRPTSDTHDRMPAAAPPAAERQPRDEVVEENFDELDFLTDDGETEERGRW